MRSRRNRRPDRDLLSVGVDFEKRRTEFHLVQEGGHSKRRILHAKDATGARIERALTQAVASSENITLRPYTLGVDLIQTSHKEPEKGIKGIWCLSLDSGEMETGTADAVLITTGDAVNSGKKNNESIGSDWRWIGSNSSEKLELQV